MQNNDSKMMPVRLRKEYWTALDYVATKRGSTKSKIVREALQEFFERCSELKKGEPLYKEYEWRPNE